MKELIEKRELILLLNEVITRFVYPFIEQHQIKNTGTFKESLDSQSTKQNEVELWGIDYSNYAVSGRAGGKRPPIASLQSWVTQKFGYNGDKAKGVAYAISNKIAREGTERHRKNLDLFEVLNSQEVKTYITTEVTKIVNKRITLMLVDEMKKITIK